MKPTNQKRQVYKEIIVIKLEDMYRMWSWFKGSSDHLCLGKSGKFSKCARQLVITMKDIKYLQGIEVNEAEGT